MISSPATSTIGSGAHVTRQGREEYPMYEDYYGFTEKPFSLTPDPRYLYKSESHASAFELLHYAMRRREGFVVVTQPAPTVSSEATVLPPAARTASPPSAPLPTQLPATTSSRATASPPSPRAPVTAVPKTQSAPTAPLQLAIHYHRTGDFDKALQQYRAVLQQNDLDAQAHNNLGLLYRDRGSLEDAVAQFRRALVVDDGYPTARNNLGVALLGLGRLDEAASALQTALERDPHHVDAMVNLALVDKAAGRHGVAMERLAGALGNDPRSAAAHYNLAVLYEHSGEESRAVHHYRRFLEHAGREHAGRVPEVRDRIGELSKGVLRDRPGIEFRLP